MLLVYINTMDDTQVAVAGTGFGMMSFFWLVFAVLVIAGMWKMFVKAGKPGWGAIVPFYNIYLMLKIAGYSGWLMLLFFVPIANFIMMIVMAFGIAKAFGRGPLFAIFGLILFSPIGTLMLGFGDAKYVGRGGAVTTANA